MNSLKPGKKHFFGMFSLSKIMQLIAKFHYTNSSKCRHFDTFYTIRVKRVNFIYKSRKIGIRRARKILRNKVCKKTISKLEHRAKTELGISCDTTKAHRKLADRNGKEATKSRENSKIKKKNLN